MAKYYKLQTPKSPWGDYSDILIRGMSAHIERKNGLIQLERTGPYIPPITLPGMGDIVVTAPFRKQLESCGLAGFSFQPVIKSHIVQLDWHVWDRSAKEPNEYPIGGEPEGYILDRPHSPEASQQLGDLWEVCLSESAKIHREGRPTRILLVASSLNGTDLFRAEGVLNIYITEKAKQWLEDHAAEHVVFEEVPTI